MEDWQQRVIDEKNQLEDRASKLAAFQGTKYFILLSFKDKDLLVKQLLHMMQYLEVLRKRISKFGWLAPETPRAEKKEADIKPCHKCDIFKLTELQSFLVRNALVEKVKRNNDLIEALNKSAEDFTDNEDEIIKLHSEAISLTNIVSYMHCVEAGGNNWLAQSPKDMRVACLQMREARAKEQDSLPKYKQYVFEGCSIEATSDMRELATTTWRRQGHKYEAGDMILRNPFCPQETWLVKKTDFESAVEVGTLPTKEQEAKCKAETIQCLKALADKKWGDRKGILIDKMQDLMEEFYKEENEAGIE